MIDSWTPADDFAEVVDTLEPIAIIRCGRAEHTLEAEAWRFEESRSDTVQAPGLLLQTIATWQFHLPADEPSPRLGDRLVDGKHFCATIRSMKRQQGSTRIVCEAVSYEFASGARQIFDVQRPVVVNGQGGSTIERWELARTGVEGCFPVVEEDPLIESGPAEVVLVGLASLQVGARLHRRGGGVFAVVRVEPPQAIGDPWVVGAEQIVA